MYIDSIMTESVLNLEIEIKLQLGSFVNYLKLAGFLGPIDSEEHQINGYYDSEDRRLSTAGWALRVRVMEDRGQVTLKGVPASRGAAVIRQELEADIPRSLALEVLNLEKDVFSIEAPPVEFVRKEFPEVSLARLVKFSNIRQKKQFKIGDYFYTLEIDRTEFFDGSIDYELEVELDETNQVEVVQDSLLKLFTSLDIPFITQGKSKYQRALERAGLI